MKRIICLLIAVMLLVLCGCGGEPEQVPLQIGEAAATDCLEFTLNEFRFTEQGVSFFGLGDDFCIPIEDSKMIPEDLDALPEQNRETIEKCVRRVDDANAYVCLEFVLKNLTEAPVEADVYPKIVFNEEVICEMNGKYWNADDAACFRESGIMWEQPRQTHPESSETVCRGFAMIPAEVQKDTEAPLYLQIDLVNAEGEIEEFVYSLR